MEKIQDRKKRRALKFIHNHLQNDMKKAGKNLFDLKHLDELENIKHGKKYVKYFLAYKDDLEFARELLNNKEYWFFKFAPREVREDEELMKVLLNDNVIMFYNVAPEKLRNDKQVIEKLANAIGQMRTYRAQEYFKDLDPELQKNKEFVLEVLSYHPSLYEHLDSKLQKDMEIAKCALNGSLCIDYENKSNKYHHSNVEHLLMILPRELIDNPKFMVDAIYTIRESRDDLGPHFNLCQHLYYRAQEKKFDNVEIASEILDYMLAYKIEPSYAYDLFTKKVLKAPEIVAKMAKREDEYSRHIDEEIQKMDVLRHNLDKYGSILDLDIDLH